MNIDLLSFIKDSFFVTVNKNYVVINKVNSTVSDYEKISNISSIQYVLPSDSLVNFYLVNDDYYQTSIQNNVVRVSIALLNIVSDNDEVLLDMQAIDSFLRNDESIKMLGLKQYQDFLDKARYFIYCLYFEKTIYYFVFDR